jgi:hypothetical protein
LHPSSEVPAIVVGFFQTIFSPKGKWLCMVTMVFFFAEFGVDPSKQRGTQR